MTPASKASVTSCRDTTWPKAVARSTAGKAANAAAGVSASAMFAVSSTSQASMARNAVTTLPCASTTNRRLTASGTAAGPKARVRTRLRKPSVPNVVCNPAPAPPRAMASGAPPCRSNGGIMVYGATVKLKLPCVLCVSTDVTCQLTL